ncbi:50S ribosomal protein L25/general stress protein Ctc [Microbacterium amylolyticum]|uniref:Large ribosomal subunit protein bL25 n=1 Tax=Microbacterium amylolyticum TaxID=936337 RepID=A0ABS4ZKF3_9MICO|nr:50S ribosomal protein L25/general stress protein Ctc [Microbacterium amylolyticum]MBP2437687.1 large subunit ribosomal protein L25 [Microbacterium amylolyticum]
MADQYKLSVDVRNEFGKGFARRLRAAGKIPAVLYGHGTEPQHLALPGHETALIVRHSNAIITLDIEGTEQLALVKDIQRDPVRRIIEHIDLVVINKGEKVQIDVPYVVEGVSFAGTMTTFSAQAIAIEADALNIPEQIVINVDGLTDGTQILAKDVVLPEGATLTDDPELLILAVTAAGSGSDADDAADAAVAEAAAAESAE